MFKCPICSNNSYSVVSSEIPGIYKCDKCSILFCNPEKFGKIDNKQNINTNNKQTHMYPPMPGAVISEPIKITRLH